MVKFTRHPGTNVFLSGPIEASRCGVIARGVAGDTIDIDESAPLAFSFAFWDSLTAATPAQIVALLSKAESDDVSTAGTGSVIFRGSDASAPAGVVRFSRTAPHRITNADRILFMGSASPTGDRYRLKLNLNGSPVHLRVVGSELRFVQPQGQIAFAKGSNGPLPLRGDLVIPFAGIPAGSVQFKIDVEDEVAFANIGARLRADFTTRKLGGMKHEPRYFPTFRPHRPKSGGVHVITLSGDVDLFDPAPDRSQLTLSATAPGGAPGLFETHFVTTYGSPVLLQSPAKKAVDDGLARAPRFVFSDQGGADDIDPNTSLLPDGDFDLILPASTKAARDSFGIVCGLSEREYLPVSAGQRLAFWAYQPAYGGPLPDKPETEVGSGFTPTTKSSWIAVLQTDGTPATTVVSEDRDYSLFEPAAALTAGVPPANGTTLRHRPIPLKPKALRAFEAVKANKPSRDALVEAASLPIFPWKGIKVASAAALAAPRAELFAGAELRRIEQRVLYPNRRALVEPDVKTVTATSAAQETRHTPMGLEMRVDAGDRMETLVLTRTPGSGQTSGAMLSLELAGIDPLLADALLRADLFLVADQLNNLATLTSGVSIAGWRFDADLAAGAKAARDGPILIIKGRKGPLKDLLGLPECWALPKELCSTDVATMADRIRDAHKDRPSEPTDPEEKAAQAAAFKKIDRIFTDPEWTGVLIYDVRLNPGAVPDQVTGLLGGVDRELRTHHVGIDVRRIEPGAAPSVTPMFGTLAYKHPKENEAPDIDAGRHYAFRLGRLLVSFDNGLVTQFLARGKLATERMFDGEASDAAPSGTRAAQLPVLDIVGRYERRLEQGEVIEVYTFETKFQGSGRVIYMPAGGLIKQLTLRKVAFVTLHVDRPGTGDLTATTRFLLDGDIVFNAWPKSEMTIIPQGAAFRFTGLGIDFKFKLDLSAFKVDIIGFDFSPGGLSLDFGKLPSVSGMLGKLPFRFRTFEIWPDGIDLPKLGFLSLNAGRGGGRIDAGNYGFTFDLSLGSLGSLAEKFKNFKLSILLGFGFDKLTGKLPQFALGYKLEGSGGSGLDIGLGNVLRIRADAYDVGKHPDASRDLYYFYAINARILVQNYELPKKARLNLFAFVDPAPQPLALPAPETPTSEPIGADAAIPALTNLGWFGVMTKNGTDQNGMVSLDTLALGQKILLFPGGDPGIGMSVEDYLDRITRELGDLPPDVKAALEKNDIKVVTSELLSRIVYDPDRAWMIGISAKVARVLDFDLLVRDPDLYGIHINFKNIINLDILYRKLSDELGVYSVTIVPPDAIRRITTGPADIILPAIGLDFYTDGGMHINLGYPYNRDFSKSASAEILPFVGSGGMRAGLFRSGGSQLVPALKHPKVFRYNPVIELGFGVRVGLGKSVEKGPFRAGVSLTVFAYLEGAQGQLDVIGDAAGLPKPAETYRVLRGAVGILGEIYGHVDFGIVKAKVEIIAYVEGGIRLRTDDATLLAYKAGVSVRITVVVARIKVFGKKIEIKVTFSYGTTIEYRMTLGKRRGNWDDVYVDMQAPLLPARRRSRAWKALSGPALRAWLVSPIVWQAADPQTLGLPSKTALPLWFMPDMAAGLMADGGARIEGVFKLYLEAAEPSADPASPYDQFARTVALWTIWNGLRDRQIGGVGDPHEWTVTPSDLQELADRIAGEALETGGKADRLPSYAVWTEFLARCFSAEITLPPNPSTKEPAREAVSFPMPGEVELLRYFGATPTVTTLQDGRFVDASFEQTVEEQFAWARRYWEGERANSMRLSGGLHKSLAEIVFEEQLGFLVRSFAQAAADAARGEASIKVGNLLDELHGSRSERPLRTAGSAASRFFHHGLALERPDASTWPTVRPHVPEPLAELGDADEHAAMPLYRYASLQLGLTRRTAARAPVGAAEAIGIRLPAGSASWFTIDAGLDRVDTNSGDPIGSFAAAAERLVAYAGTVRYVAALDTARLIEARPNDYAAAAIKPLSDAANTLRERALSMPDDLTHNEHIKVSELRVHERDLKGDQQRLITVEPGIVLTIRLRRAANVAPDAQNRTLYEIIGAREADRLLLDGLTSASGTGSTNPPTVGAVELYASAAPDPDTGAISHWWRIADTARIVQSNLASEPRPEARAASAGAQYQAEQREASMFVEIYRRASIVNSPGYWLLVAEEGGGAPEIELLMVVRLRNAATLTCVNALLTADIGGGDDVVTTISAGSEIRLLPRPGEVPIDITVANPALAFRVDLGTHVEHLSFDELAERQKARTTTHKMREVYADALEAQGPDAALRERYDLLEVHVAANRDFVGTKPGRLLPVGNTGDDAGAPPRELNFKHTLPLHHLLATPAASPYAAVGRTLDVRFRLRDIYGNSLPGPARPGTGEFAAPITVQYCDGLVSPSDLPYLQWSWDTGRRGTLKLVALFDRAAFEDGSATDPALRAQRLDLIRSSYRLALWQLQGPGFSAAVRTTLVADGPSAGPWEPAEPADAAIDRSALERFFGDILKLADKAVSRRRSDPRLELEIAVVKPADAAFIEPRLSLVFMREKSLVHPRIRDVSNACETSLQISMAYENIVVEAAREAELRAFAERLTRNVLNSGYVGAKGGPARTGSSGASLWLVRSDVLPGAGTGKGSPEFVAMPPLSNRPESFKELAYTKLLTGDQEEPVTADLVDLDLDAYAQIALERIEILLHPAQLVRLSQLPEGASLIEAALTTKEHLARQLSERAVELLDGAAVDPKLVEEARSGLRSRLLARLTAAYQIDTLLAYELGWTSATASTALRPAVIGRLDIVTAAPERSAPGDLQLVSLPEQGAKSSPLIVPYDLLPTDRPKAAPSVEVGDFAVTHVQRHPQLDRTETLKLPPEQRYRATQWLRLLDVHVVKQFRKTFDVPVAVRRLPEKPLIAEQSFTQTEGAGASLDAWRKCELRARWKWAGTPNDNPVAVTRYWTSSDQSAVSGQATGTTLGKALLVFVLSTQECWPRLTDPAPYSVGLLRYVTRQLTLLQNARATASLADPAAVEDRVRWKHKNAAWIKDLELLQPGHAVEFTIEDSKGEALFKNIDVMRYSRAQFGLEIYRNRAFEMGGNEREANAPFVYHLKDIWAAEPLIPHVRRPDILEFNNRRPLREHLAAILDGVFTGKLGRHRFDVHLSLVPMVLPEGLSGSGVPGDWPGVPMPPVVGLFSDKPADWTKIADAAEAWLDDAAIETATGYVGVWIRVYRQASGTMRGQVVEEAQPIFEAQRLRIPLSAISDI